METCYPHISELATRTYLSEIELRLIKEIEQVRLEVARVRADTGRDSEHARGSLLLWSFGFWVTQLVVLLTLLWRLWPMTAS
ncbi:MAG: hypothetical protein ACUVSD_10905 [Thiobacillaceae bacterium]